VAQPVAVNNYRCVDSETPQRQDRFHQFRKRVARTDNDSVYVVEAWLLAIDVDTALPGERAVRVLDQL